MYKYFSDNIIFHFKTIRIYVHNNNAAVTLGFRSLTVILQILISNSLTNIIVKSLE